jgi:hypothetical protein
MSQVRFTSPLLTAINIADGVKVTPDSNGDVTLTTATYVFVLGGADAPLESVHIVTDATIAMSSIAVDTCNLPRNTGAESVAPPGTVTDYAAITAGHWVPEEPTDAYVATTGTGWGGSGLAITKTAGAGGAMIHLGNMGAARSRLRMVVTTGGKVCVAVHAKS